MSEIWKKNMKWEWNLIWFEDEINLGELWNTYIVAHPKPVYETCIGRLQLKFEKEDLV